MKLRARATLSLVVLAVGLLPAGQAAAQTAPGSDARLAAVVAQFPAQTPAERDRLAGDLLALGESGLIALARQLAPAGGGSDTEVRYALNAVAVHASQPGAESRRALVEKAFVRALARASTPEVRTFLLSQLQIVGRDGSVKAAAPYLSDAVLVEPATQLMLAVNNAAARKALNAALPKATGQARITIVRALGELKVADANGRLLKLANDPDAALRKDTLAALARIASPKSFDVMTGAAKAADFRYEPANATGSLMEYARQLARNGQQGPSEKVCRLVMSNTDDAERLPTRTAALAVLVSARGGAALPDLLSAVDHADPEYRSAALQLAERLRGPAPLRAWIEKARATDAVRRSEIIAMLGRQGDAGALPYIRESLADPEPDVCLAAARALAHAERAGAVPDLLALLKPAAGDTARQIGDLLLWTIDEQHLDPLAGMLDALPPQAKAAAIAVIGARGGRRFSARIVPLTSDPAPEIRAAAVAALAGVAGPGDLPALFTLLAGADEASIAPVQKAIVAAARQIMPETAQATPLVEAITTSERPERIVELLGQIGGPQALNAAIQQFASPSADVRAAAFRALARWPGLDATETLFAIFASGDETYRNQAFSGFVRQIAASQLPAEQKILQLRRAMAKASTVGDRRILIRNFQNIKTFQSFLQVVPFLDDPDLANEAAGAVMRLAVQTPGTQDGLSGTLVRKALTKAMQVVTGAQADANRESIRAYLAAMPEDEGFVPIFNGNDLAGWKGLVENPIARAKMTAGELAAKQAAADAKMQANWTVRDGAIVFNGSGDNLCTVKDYGDFEMIVDWRITKGGDSGIYLRGTPQVQIWDPARTDVGAEVGSGGLYNNQKYPSKPLVFADNPVGDWNTFRVTMIGDRVTVVLNGVKVVDGVTMENYWDRKQPIFPTGAIELQAHGTDLAFRDLYVREIPRK